MSIEATLYQETVGVESTIVSPDTDGNWTMEPPQTTVMGIDDYLEYRTKWTDGTNVIYSEIVTDTVTGLAPNVPTITSNDGEIYINDKEVDFNWDGSNLPEGWKYISARIQGYTFTRLTETKHTLNQSFTPTTSETNPIVVTDCPYYAINDYIMYRVEATYEDNEGTQYTIGSKATKYEIRKCAVPTITHIPSVRFPTIEGTCNVGENKDDMSVGMKIYRYNSYGVEECVALAWGYPDETGVWSVDLNTSEYVYWFTASRLQSGDKLEYATYYQG